MYIQHVMGLFSHPRLGWKVIKDERYNIVHLCLTRLSILAAIPALALFFGVTQVGWSFSGDEYHTFPIMKALATSIIFFFSMLVGALFMAYFVFWLEKTYGANASFERCLIFITYTALPMYVAGLVALLPIVWLCVFVIMSAAFYSLYLLYVGLPIFMEIPEGLGFMFATSIIMAGLCTLVGWLAIIAVIWANFIM
jgi:hypothetical protein